MDCVVQLQGITRSFDDGHRTIDVLKDLELKVRPGEFVAVLGPSGAGKSTLLNIICGLDTAFIGTAQVFGQELKAMSDDQRSVFRNQKIGFVFQSFHLLEHLSLLENVCVPGWLNIERIAADPLRAQGLEVLQRVGLQDRADAPIGVLSGGERQRIVIARAMINRPQLILADEPTGNLDRVTGASVVSCFDEMRSQGEQAVIVVTHDALVAERADRVLHLEAGTLTSPDAGQVGV